MAKNMELNASIPSNTGRESDDDTTVRDLRRLVSEFVSEREWEKFHSPKNLSMSLAIEAAELMEHFQWLTIDESRSVVGDSEQLANVGEELADVLCYAFAIANSMNLDISQVVQQKMAKNREKYPVEKFKGKFE